MTTDQRRIASTLALRATLLLAAAIIAIPVWLDLRGVAAGLLALFAFGVGALVYRDAWRLAGRED